MKLSYWFILFLIATLISISSLLNSNKKNCITKRIAILGDVSGSMREPFKNFDANDNPNIDRKSSEIIEMLKSLSNNLNIQMFGLLFGSDNPEIINIIKLLEITKKYFPNKLMSDENTIERTFRNKIVDYINDYGLRSEYKQKTNIDEYIFLPEGPNERLCEFVVSILSKNPQNIK